MSSIKKHRPFPGCEVLHNIEPAPQPLEVHICHCHGVPNSSEKCCSRCSQKLEEKVWNHVMVGDEKFIHEKKVQQLLSQQKAEIREKIERLDYPEQFQDLTHFRNGYDFAIEDVLKLLEEDIK